MKTLLAITFCISTIAISTDAEAGETSPENNSTQIETTVTTLADAQVRVLSKAVAFCVAHRQPEERPLDVSLRSYVEAFSSGTKAGMIEIAKIEKAYVDSGPVFQGKDFEMMDRQAESILMNVQASPATECMKLGAFLDAGTSAVFKQSTLQSHREYRAKRAEYCSRLPKPKNCE